MKQKRTRQIILFSLVNNKIAIYVDVNVSTRLFKF